MTTDRALLEQAVQAANLEPATQTFVEAVLDRADLPRRLAKMSLVFRQRKQRPEAEKLARLARQLAAGDDYPVWVLTDWLERRQAPLWHFGIVHDERRNAAYAEALRHFVTPDTTVFEIGTGTGILAMLAARAGAKHVYTCERREDVAAAAREIIARNGFAERITVIAKDAHQVRVGTDLPERCNLFVAEIVDNSLLGEQVLPLTQLARERFLTADAGLLPRSVAAIGYAVTGQGQAHKYRMGQISGFDMTPFNRFTPIEINAGKGGGELHPLTAPTELARFDLDAAIRQEGEFKVNLIATRAGEAQAICRWLRLDFGAGILFENNPPHRSCWDPQLHILPQPPLLDVGDPLALTLQHDQDALYLWPTA